MENTAELVITAVGPDRPGIVSDLAGVLASSGANVADSRMVNLHGRFAVVMLVEGDEGALVAARARLGAEAGRLGLAVTFGAETAAATAASGVPYHLRTYSPDRPGILHEVAESLRRHDVNIESLETRLEPAPFSGTRLFTPDLDMIVPAQVRVRELRDELAELCSRLNADFDLEPARG